MPKMTHKKFQLLSCLRANSREKLTKISKKTNIPISTLFDQLKALQNSIITKSTVLLNFYELGYHTRAQVFLKVNKEEKEKIKKHLSCHSNINTIYKINNNWDFIIETVHKNIRELDNFLENLDREYSIEKRRIHYLIEDVKIEGFMFS